MKAQDFRTHLEHKFPDQSFARWFDSLDIHIDAKAGMVQVDFPHRFFGDWFVREKSQWFEKELDSFHGGLQIRYGQGLAKQLPGLQEKKTTDAPVYRGLSEECIPGTSFASFIVNKKNDFVLTVAKKMANEATSPPHTPFVLYGQVGSGKTHLINAMVTSLCRAYPSLPFYMGSVASLLEESSPGEVRAFFLDNFHYIAENKALQKKFVPFFDSVQRGNLLLCVCMDSHPEHTPGLDQKIKQRLKSGLVMELKKPDLDIRLKYIIRSADAMGFAISKEEALKMAQRYQDFREIDGAMALILTHTTLGMNKTGRLSLLVHGEAEKIALTHTGIMAQVAEYFGVSLPDIVGKSRQKNITLARQAAIYFCRELLGLSLSQIGHLFGDRDHSSIVYTLNKVQELQHSNKVIHKHFAELKKLFLT